MRLICSNCDAQYEVDDSVIPETGRDVQCSNCGHAWFQPGALQSAAEADEDEALAAAPEPDPGYDDAAPVEDARAPEPPLAPPHDVGAEAPEPDVAVRPPARPALDDELLSVLKEEAEREEQARRAEGTADLEIQPDLGLPEAPPAAPVPGPERVADLNAVADDDAGHGRGNRRGLLPDIEEINSTLSASPSRAASDDDEPSPEVIARRRGDFRLGFSISLIAAVLLLALYVLAPSLALQAPALAPALTAYVTAVNEARLWIDEFMRSSTEAMRGTSG